MICNYFVIIHYFVLLTPLLIMLFYFEINFIIVVLIKKIFSQKYKQNHMIKR